MLHNLQIVSIYFNSSIQNNKFFIFILQNFKFWHARVCMHAGQCACVCMSGSQRKDIGCPALALSYPTKAVSHWMWSCPPPDSQLLGRPAAPGIQILQSLPAPSNLYSQCCGYGVCSDVRVLGNWTQILKLGQQKVLPMEPFPQPLITKF